MHGIELCDEERRTLRPSAPRPVFSPPAGSVPPGHAAAFNSLSPPGPEVGSGLSLTRNEPYFSQGPFRGQCSRPAASLRCAAIPKFVRLSAPQPDTGSPRSGCFYASARFFFRAALHQLPLPTSAPLRDVYSLWIEVFNRVSRRLVRLANAPDFLSLPGFVSIASSETGSPFLVRFALAG